MIYLISNKDLIANSRKKKDMIDTEFQLKFNRIFNQQSFENKSEISIDEEEIKSRKNI